MIGSSLFRGIWEAMAGVSVMLALAACQKAPSDTPTSGVLPVSQPASQAATRPDLRLVSLSPAVTRTLVDFNLQSRLVGRSAYCFSVDKGIPVVGDLSNINFEMLTKVKPTHILVQPPESGISEPLVRAAKENGWTIASWRLNTLEDIEAMIRGIPPALFPAGSADLENAARRAAELENTIAQAMSPGGRKLWRGSVLMTSDDNPVLAFGKGTYLSDVLAGFGCTNVVEANGWVQLSMEDVTRINPHALILTLPGFDVNQGMIAAAGPLWSADITASTERRIGVVTNWDSFLPSSAIVSSINEIRDLLAKWEELGPSPEPAN